MNEGIQKQKAEYEAQARFHLRNIQQWAERVSENVFEHGVISSFPLEEITKSAISLRYLSGIYNGLALSEMEGLPK